MAAGVCLCDAAADAMRGECRGGARSGAHMMLSRIPLSISNVISTLVGIAVFIVTSRADSTAVPPAPLKVSIMVMVVSFDSPARIVRALIGCCTYSFSIRSHCFLFVSVDRRGARRGGGVDERAGVGKALCPEVRSVGSAA